MAKYLNKLLYLIIIFALLIVTSCAKSTKNSYHNENVSSEDVEQTKDELTSSDSGVVDKKYNNQILNVGLYEQCSNINLLTAENLCQFWILEHTLEGLTKINEAGNIVGGMAQTWETEDGIVWNFTLKENIKWSDGSPITAYDFEYSWKHTLNPQTSSQNAYQLYYIAGAEQYNNETNGANLHELEENLGVVALNKLKLQVTLMKPIPYFPKLTTLISYAPMKKQANNAQKNFNNNSQYIANGPFKIIDNKNDSTIKLAVNDYYYDKKNIKLTEINFTTLKDIEQTIKMYEKGDLDVIYQYPEKLRLNFAKDGNLKTTSELTSGLYFYNLNNKIQPLNNRKIRQALSISINRAEIINKVSQLRLRPAYRIIPTYKNLSKENENISLFEEDILKARQLLEEGLEEEGLKDFPELTLTYNINESHQAITELIKTAWHDNLGININLEGVSFEEKITREHFGHYHISRSGWLGDTTDPLEFLNLWTALSQYNDVNWENDKYDNLIAKSLQTFNEEERNNLLKKAEKILVTEMPVIPIYFYEQRFLVTTKVKGIYTPLNKHPQLMYAYF